MRLNILIDHSPNEAFQGQSNQMWLSMGKQGKRWTHGHAKIARLTIASVSNNTPSSEQCVRRHASLKFFLCYYRMVKTKVVCRIEQWSVSSSIPGEMACRWVKQHAFFNWGKWHANCFEELTFNSPFFHLHNQYLNKFSLAGTRGM